MIIQQDQNMFDIALQGFGSLDNVVNVSNDNQISITDNLTFGSSIDINNEDLGEEDIKKEIIEKGITYNNVKVDAP